MKERREREGEREGVKRADVEMNARKKEGREKRCAGEEARGRERGIEA